MVAAYALDVRQRVRQACAQGGKTKAVAARLAVSPALVRTFKRRRRLPGTIAALPKRQAHAARLRALIHEPLTPRCPHGVNGWGAMHSFQGTAPRAGA